MLSDIEIYELAKKMRIPNKIECIYKSNLYKTNFKPEKAYIINLADEEEPNFGTHYTLLIRVRTESGPRAAEASPEIEDSWRPGCRFQKSRLQSAP